jgi:DHA1 family bicyclomycin/chloramphenicol resistance-like MFS transporter
MSSTPSPKPAARFAARRSFVLLIAALATIGPFSMDTFLPSLPELQVTLGATPVQAQQALSAYLLGFGLMSLWHGAISDAVGRRPVIITALVVYAMAALACTLAPSIEVLIGARLVQGLFGGAGAIVSRAIVRDCFEGAEAQRMMSSVMLLFAVAPALAPVVGGYLHEWWGWRSVFGFMLAGSLVLLAWTWKGLPETHPPEARVPLDWASLARSYARVLTRREFQLLAGTIAFNFSTFFVYIMAAPAFIMRHLGMGTTEFGWFFIPVVGGMMLGATLSGRMAGQISSRRMANLGFLLMISGVSANLALQLGVAPGMTTGRLLTFLSIAPLVVSAIGQSMITPSVQLLMMDLFPHNRGMVASGQGFTQVMLSALTAGVIAPLVSDTAAHLALAGAAFLVAGGISWMLYLRVRRR